MASAISLLLHDFLSTTNLQLYDLTANDVTMQRLKILALFLPLLIVSGMLRVDWMF